MIRMWGRTSASAWGVRTPRRGNRMMRARRVSAMALPYGGQNAYISNETSVEPFIFRIRALCKEP